MDNKKWGKRFSTIFWWILTILPLIIALIYFIGFHLTFNSGITSAQELSTYHLSSNGSFLEYLNHVFWDSVYPFDSISFDFLINMFFNLFETLGFNPDGDGISTITSLFAWMASVQFYHVIYDVAIWLFRIIHSWLERWYA